MAMIAALADREHEQDVLFPEPVDQREHGAAPTIDAGTIMSRCFAVTTA